MHGQLLSNTRRLNRHYQSAGKTGFKVLYDWTINHVLDTWQGDIAAQFPVRLGKKYYFYTSGDNSTLIPRYPLSWYRPRLCIRFNFSFDRTYQGTTTRVTAQAYAPGQYIDLRNAQSGTMQNTMYQSSSIVLTVGAERLETSGYVNGFKIYQLGVQYTPGATWVGGGTLDNVAIDSIEAIGYSGVLGQTGFFGTQLPAQYIPFVTVPTTDPINAMFVLEV